MTDCTLVTVLKMPNRRVRSICDMISAEECLDVAAWAQDVKHDPYLADCEVIALTIHDNHGHYWQWKAPGY